MPDFRSLTLKHLRAHEATVRLGSVTAAARELLVTPPAITSQLKSLENLAGAPLYDRSVDNFVPTAVGQVLLDCAEDIDRLIGRTDAKIAALRSGAVGAVVFAAVSTAKYIAPTIVARFQAAHPDMSVKLVIGNRQEIVRGLENNEFDVLLMGRPPTHVPLESSLLCDHPQIVVAPPEHALAKKKHLTPSDLVGERFLSRESGSGTRELMERFLARVSARQSLEVVEMGTNETIKQAVMAGLGIAFLSAHTCVAELSDRKLIVLPVAGLPIVRQWYLIHRSDREVSTAAQIFEDFVLKNKKQLIPDVPKSK
jgi:LysR family transcriptional regulator, low CO2-responsive transcriptional regulator